MSALRSITGRVVLLTTAVALASSLLTVLVLARALAATNVETATANLVAGADNLADAVADPRRPADVRRLAAFTRLAARSGYVVEVVEAGQTPSRRPFTAADVRNAAPDTPAVTRDDEGKDWLVVARPAGNQVVLAARRLSPALRLTPVQRRRALLGGGLGLLGGGLGGLLLAVSITGPLRRLAADARRLSAGERDVAVGRRGPREVIEVAQALSGLNAALATSEARQRSFLLAVSHELRTPLTAVTGYAEAIADQAIPPREIPQAAAVIREEAGRLQRRVEDLLALARLEADDFRLRPAPTDVGAVLRAAAEAFGPRAASGDVRLTVQVPAAGPVLVLDGERLRQAVDALIDNALRVLPPQAPLVLACGSTDDGTVRVEVRDGGPGLAAADLAVAFERGVLTERYRGSRPVGSGVGLALVGELVRRMGGRARAIPAPEGGVCFVLTFGPA